MTSRIVGREMWAAKKGTNTVKTKSAKTHIKCHRGWILSLKKIFAFLFKSWIKDQDPFRFGICNLENGEQSHQWNF